jgi:ATP-dependent Lon protease
MSEQNIMDVELKIPTELPILPLKDTVVFPGMIVPITVGKPASIKLVDDVSVKEKLCGLVLQKKKIEDEGTLYQS